MSFRQISLILKREYLTKVRTKAFILTTILIPLGMLAFMGVGVGIALWDSDTEHTIGIVDHTQTLLPRLQEIDQQRYKNLSGLSEDSLRAMIQQDEIEGYIVLNKKHITSGVNPELVYGGGGGIQLLSSLENDLEEAIRAEQLSRANVSEQVKQIYANDLDLSSIKLTEAGQKTEDNTGFLSAVGMLMGVFIFVVVLGYGGYLTRSVLEEKTSRIVEVVVSSVKPIELLIGKMGGICALALTQISIWIIAFVGLGMAAAPVAGLFIGGQTQKLSSLKTNAAAQPGFDASMLQLPAIDPMLFVYFVLFFLLGYLIYSSLFAAIGAAADSDTDTQQFMFPIMVPIMIGYFIMFQAMSNPDGSLSVIGSLIPFFAPMVMITRIAITDVPFWQIALSVLLMITTFAGTMWLSAKIYAVGILSYGKSASYKDLLKWIKHG